MNHELSDGSQMEEAGVAAGAAAGAGALPGPSQPTFCGRPRKSGVANIFQGVNLRQLRRLFQSAGEPDPERRARQVWGGRRAGEGAGDDDEEEEEEHLAQALVGLRVRARTRSGIRAESARGGRSFNR